MTTNYKLFLDDERHPIDDSWTIARNYQEAVNLIQTKGLPQAMSLDHDLSFVGYTQTGYDFVKWLIDYCMDNNLELDCERIRVHSMNPVGRQNMKKLLHNFRRYQRDNKANVSNNGNET